MLKAIDSWLRTALLGLTLVPLSCLADQALKPATENSLLRCLQTPPADDAPTYPSDDLEKERKGWVRVNLKFTRNDLAPDVEVLFDSGTPAMKEQVLRYVSRYRLPCMPPAEEPVIATQEFNFSPDKDRPTYWSHVVGEDERALRLFHCVEQNDAERDRARYPTERGKMIQGRALARVRFVSADDPPQVEMVFGESQADFVRHWISHYRMPCFPAGGDPVVGIQLFDFKVEGASSVEFKHLTLRQFLGSVDHVEQHPGRFDLSTMGCPFAVLVSLYQPYIDNDIGEVGSTNPNRRAFLDWIKSMKLKLPEQTLRQVIGSSIQVSVPCGTVDML